MNTDTANAADIDLRDRDAVAAVLRTVPRRFVVGFAARCARRVQPELLVRGNWDDGVVLYHLADGFISIAEGYASGLIQRCQCRDMTWERRQQLRNSSAHPAAAHIADDAVAAAYAATESATTASEADAVIGVTVATAYTALAACTAVKRRGVVPSLIHDFKAVRALSRNKSEDFNDDRPVPEGFFGPLWVDGMPEEYKAALAKLKPEKAPTPEVEPDNFLVDLDDEGRAALADEVWMNQEYNRGTFDEFGGEYIAVVGKKVLGHDRSLLKLREIVTAETGIPARRIVTTLVTRRRQPTLTPEVEPDNYLADLDDEGKAALADEVWVNEHYSRGTFDEFRGEFIAVVGQKVLGHGKNPHKLRELVSAETGIPANRIVTTLIFRQQWK